MEDTEQQRHNESDDIFKSDFSLGVAREMELSSISDLDVDEMNSSYLSIFSADSFVMPMDLSPFSSPNKFILSPTKLMAESSDESWFNNSLNSSQDQNVLNDEYSISHGNSNEFSNKPNNKIEFRLSGRSLGCLQRLPKSNGNNLKRQISECRRILINNSMNSKRPDLVHCLSECSAVSNKNCKILPKSFPESIRTSINPKNNKILLNSVSNNVLKHYKNCKILPKKSIETAVANNYKNCNILSKNMASRNLFSETSSSKKLAAFLPEAMHSRSINNNALVTKLFEDKKYTNLTPDTNLDDNISMFSPAPLERRLSMPIDAPIRLTSPSICSRRRTISKVSNENLFKDNLELVASPPLKIITFSDKEELKVIASTPKRLPTKYKKIKSEPGNLDAFDENDKVNSSSENSICGQTLTDIKISIETPSKNLINDDHYCLSPLMLSFTEDDDNLKVPIIKNSYVNHYENDGDDEIEHQIAENSIMSHDDDGNEGQSFDPVEEWNKNQSYKRIACGNTKASQTLIELAHMYIQTKDN